MSLQPPVKENHLLMIREIRRYLELELIFADKPKAHALQRATEFISNYI